MANQFCINVSGNRKINIEVYPQHAPVTVENFTKLVKSGFYSGLCFHRVIAGFMIQGGGFKIENGELNQKASANIRGEFTSNKVANELKHTTGTISMARARDKDSASSQFFICAADCAYLDGEYAAFGRATDENSLKNIKEISEADTGKWMHFDDVPVEPIIIESITEL
ncbi:peptidyl-prolyl cis-trans isomerase cyp38 chloroplastic [Holotrichia oblita]|nr:peptidyl-prolyl cis-trans isomerase cyp38 chloroplastic [Holotrichia oblita]